MAPTTKSPTGKPMRSKVGEVRARPSTIARLKSGRSATSGKTETPAQRDSREWLGTPIAACLGMRNTRRGFSRSSATDALSSLRRHSTRPSGRPLSSAPRPRCSFASPSPAGTSCRSLSKHSTADGFSLDTWGSSTPAATDGTTCRATATASATSPTRQTPFAPIQTLGRATRSSAARASSAMRVTISRPSTRTTRVRSSTKSS